jgi:hypothetical protein
MSSCPFLAVSSLSNSTSINFIHSCLKILPFLSVSIRSSNCLTSSSPRLTFSCGYGTVAFCATAVPSMAQVAADTTIAAMTNPMLVRFNMIGSAPAFAVSPSSAHERATPRRANAPIR